MESWASGMYKRNPNIQFATICVESKEVAVAFHNMFQFQNVINGYIPSRFYLPVGYGQLGCSGFIVSDAQGCFVSKKTKAFLQFGEDAFRHVEEILEILNPRVVLEDGESGNSDEKKQQEEDAISISSTKVEEQEVDLKKKIEPPSSVGVDSMDDEHRECTNSFNAAISNPCPDTLFFLFNVLRAHFEHEESLMQQHLSKVSSFSALDSHIMDHEQILNIAKVELDRVNGCGLSGGSM